MRKAVGWAAGVVWVGSWWGQPAVAGDAYQTHRRVVVEPTTQLEGAPCRVIRLLHHTHVRPWVPPRPASVQEALARPKAIAAINGGFFDPQSGEAWGHVGHRTGGYPGHWQAQSQPALAPGLRQHPWVGPRLPHWLGERVEWRESQGCGLAWDIQAHRRWSLDPNEAQAALQAGPRLLPRLTLQEEGFLFPGGEDLLASRQALPRAALALTGQGDMLWVVVQAPGLSLPRLAKGLAKLGAVAAMGLDGGAEASLAWRTTTGPSTVVVGDGAPQPKAVPNLLVAYSEGTPCQ